MKTDARQVRSYDLNENSGDYVSKDDLRFWLRFDPTDKFQGNGKLIPNKAAIKSSVQARAILTVPGTSVALPIANFLTDDSAFRGTFKDRQGALITQPNSVLQLPFGNFSDIKTNIFTVGAWLRFDNEIAGEGRDAPLIRVTAGDVRLEITYDKDGGGSPHYYPAIRVQAEVISTSTVVGDATYVLDNTYLAVGRMTGWHQVVVACGSPTVVSSATDPGDWKVMFDAKDVSPTINSVATRPDSEPLDTIEFGGPSLSAVSGTKIKWYEVGVWKSVYPKTSPAAVKTLYSRGTTSYSSGILNVPPRAQILKTECVKDAYPTITRSTDQDRLNRSVPFFDDQTSTIDFGPVVSGALNYPTLLRSGSAHIKNLVSSPNEVPNIYVKKEQATALFTVITSTPADLDGEWFTITDAKPTPSVVTFTGNSTYSVPERIDKSNYVFGLDGVSSSKAAIALAVQQAVDLAQANGDLLTNLTYYLGRFTQQVGGEAGNTPITKSFSNTLIAISSGFTGGVGPRFTVGNVPSIVVGGYEVSTPGSHACPLTPFDDSSMPVDIALEPAYIPAFAPGFTKTLGDRVMIEIDITPSQEHFMAVWTGSQGDVSRMHPAQGGPNRPNDTKTGMVYFNFTDRKWEDVGGLVPMSVPTTPGFGNLMKWNLPMEYSGTDAPGGPGQGVHRNRGSNWTLNSMQAFWGLDLASKAFNTPRLFQPFPSTIAHRSTFNFLYDFDYLILTGSGTGNAYDGGGAYEPAIELQGVWNTTYPDSFRGYGDVSNSSHYSASARFQNDVVNWLASDMLGLTKPIGTVTSQSFDQRYPKVWNVKDGGSGSVFYDAVANDLGAMGLPIAYSQYSTHTRFYASSSHLLRVGDYTDLPILLEAVEIETEVETKRLFYTTIEQDRGGRGSNVPAEVSAWSTTNNHVDCLTYFIARQSEPGRPGRASAMNQASNSRRELITWSNNVFFSPFLGWDFWQ